MPQNATKRRLFCAGTDRALHLERERLRGKRRRQAKFESRLEALRQQRKVEVATIQRRVHVNHYVPGYYAWALLGHLVHNAS